MTQHRQNKRPKIAMLHIHLRIVRCIKVSSERNDDARPARPPSFPTYCSEIYPAKYIQITAAHQRAARWRSKGYLCTYENSKADAKIFRSLRWDLDSG